jgi:hypothetical protein
VTRTRPVPAVVAAAPPAVVQPVPHDGLVMDEKSGTPKTGDDRGADGDDAAPVGPPSTCPAPGLGSLAPDLRDVGSGVLGGGAVAAVL